MTTFDQRNQKVTYQYNSAGDINFAQVQNVTDIVAELRKLQSEIQKATSMGAVSPQKAVDMKSRIEKSITEVQKPKPDKKTTIDYLNEAKALIEGVASAAGLITGITQAAEAVMKFFK